MLPFAVVFVLAAFNGGGGGGVATDIQDLSIAFPSSSTGHPPPSPPAHIVVTRLGNSVWGFSDGSSRGGRRQLSSPLFLFIIVLIVVYDIEQPQGEGEEGTTGDTESSHGGEEAI